MTPDDPRAVGEAVRVPVVCGAQQQKRRIDRAAGDYDDVGRIFLERAAAFHETLRHRAPLAVGVEPSDVGVCEQRHIGVIERRVDADPLRISLAVYRAWIAVEGIAADAGAVALRLPLCFVQKYPER